MTKNPNELGKPAQVRTNVGWGALILLSLPSIASAQQIAIGGYPVPYTGAQPASIAAGSDGALWFTEVPLTTGSEGGIGRMTPAGVFSEYRLPYPETRTGNIVSGPDGALWFTEYTANQVGRITTAGRVTAYAVPTANSGPSGITVGPDGALWFTEANANQIGRITTAGHVTEYPVPTAGSGPSGITAGPDSALWFTEYDADQIARITIAGHVTEYPVPTAGSQPNEIALGPDNAMWFTEVNANQIGRITRAGAVTEYPVPTPDSVLADITAGPDGALWFTELNAAQIGRITTEGVITSYPVPAPIISFPGGIATGPDGSLWLTEEGIASAIGQVVFETASLSARPESAAYEANLSFTGSGFAPGENVEIYTSGIGSAALTSATADNDGSIAATAAAPQAPYGPRLFLGVGQSSGNTGAASFTTLSKLVLNPDSGPVGATVTVQGYGFGHFDSVTVTWNSPRTFLGRVAADANGNFSGLTFTVPAGALAGSNAVLGTDFVPGAGVYFTVE
jgi:virginiamycin B lyase